jgi:hypothetical protein
MLFVSARLLRFNAERYGSADKTNTHSGDVFTLQNTIRAFRFLTFCCPYDEKSGGHMSEPPWSISTRGHRVDLSTRMQ